MRMIVNLLSRQNTTEKGKTCAEKIERHEECKKVTRYLCREIKAKSIEKI